MLRDLEADWYRVACDSRPDWASDAPDPLVLALVTCFTCARHFARQGDLARHKCRAERQKPVVSALRVIVGSGAAEAWLCIVAPLLPRA